MGAMAGGTGSATPRPPLPDAASQPSSRRLAQGPAPTVPAEARPLGCAGQARAAARAVDDLRLRLRANPARSPGSDHEGQRAKSRPRLVASTSRTRTRPIPGRPGRLPAGHQRHRVRQHELQPCLCARCGDGQGQVALLARRDRQVPQLRPELQPRPGVLRQHALHADAGHAHHGDRCDDREAGQAGQHLGHGPRRQDRVRLLRDGRADLLQRHAASSVRPAATTASAAS